MPFMPDKPTKPASPRLAVLSEEKTGALHLDDSVQTAGIRMRDLDTSKWPVAKDRKLVGMVDHENPDWKSVGNGHDPKATKVGEIMSESAVFCYEDEDCASAERLMEERGLGYLPVVDREMRLIGIFTRAEIQAKLQPAAPTASE
jgi:predicted transcriptional regulator